MVKKMKRIFIFSHALELGGAERALLGLLNSIDTSKYSVDLFLMRHTGELLKYIPEEINLLPEVPQYASLAVPIGEVLRKRQFCVAVGRTVGKLRARQYVKKNSITGDNGVALEYSHKYTRYFMPRIGAGEYDLAISFLTPHYFVAEKVKAKCKIAWIHTDYSYIAVNVVSEEKMWNKYDHVISISDAVTSSFSSKFPSLSKKLVKIENINSPEFIRQQAQEFDVNAEMPDNGSIKLLSVGRFCEAKNFDNVPDICRRIVEAGLNVKWYLIGFGNDEMFIRKKIEETGMKDRVIILGKKSNPYPYISACDLYVQPSRFEGKAVTVVEAQILSKPVVITKYETSSSQLKDGYDGVIVPMDNEDCAKGIIDILEDTNLRERLIFNMRRTDYSNKCEITKLYALNKIV